MQHRLMQHGFGTIIRSRGESCDDATPCALSGRRRSFIDKLAQGAQQRVQNLRLGWTPVQVMWTEAR